MSAVDNTDAEILRLLMEDARRPYSEIAEAVGLSPPAVSDRIDKLHERGIIRRFTLDIDRSLLFEGGAVFVTMRVHPDATDEVMEVLEDTDGVERIFETIDARILFNAYLTDHGLRRLFTETLDEDRIIEYDVRKISNSAWKPQVSADTLGVECAVCGRAITDESVSIQLDERSYQLCCTSCASQLAEQYEELSQSVSED